MPRSPSAQPTPLDPEAERIAFLSGLHVDTLKNLTWFAMCAAFRITENYEDAEEAAQSAMLIAWKKRDEAGNPLRAWIWRIAQNQAKQLLTKKTRLDYRNPDDLYAELAEQGPMESDEDSAMMSDWPPELITQVKVWIPELKPRPVRGQCIQMKLLEGLNGPKIAEKLGITQNAFYSHIHRGLRKLKQKANAWLVLNQDKI